MQAVLHFFEGPKQAPQRRNLRCSLLQRRRRLERVPPTLRVRLGLFRCRAGGEEEARVGLRVDVVLDKGRGPERVRGPGAWGQVQGEGTGERAPATGGRVKDGPGEE